ncbi:hypothetical protein RclHR1_00930016 [Rhizophagus clarus]|uniref:HAT C-terminal dimerisation domain-containing protein n=1 Tax=Rhizophagus clarus TaxID=94130 RepID=A0A2Z6S3R9_9GLOM|nr:hypothetical protein RclHR1_00930016 [Rhizophagus clarus]
MDKSRANKSNKYAVCRACISIIGKDEAYKLKFTNTKKECARHIKNYQNFAQKYSPQQITKLLDDAAKDGVKSKPPQKRCCTESSSESSDNDNDDSILEQNKNNNNLKETSNLDGITLDNYIFSLTIIQEQKLEQFLLDVTVSCGLAFQWIKDPAVKSLFNWLNPMITLPSRKVLSGRILKDATDKVSTKLLDNAKDDLFGVILAFDGWKNMVRQHIFGIILITSTGKMIIWKAINCDGNRGTANEIIQITQQLFAELNQENIKVNGLVTDSVSENASARKQLQLLYRDKLFLPCFAYQMNLCVGRDANGQFGLNLATKIEEQESDDLYDFPEEYLNCISDNNWWKKLKELETLILPYFIVLRSFDNNNFKNKLLKKLEKRWSDWEQPLLLLAFLLHPGYRTDKFNPQIETLSFPHLGKWVTYYYCAWFNEDPMELYHIAERIFSIAVTTASLERLFSTMGWLHSKRQNRLAHKKVLGMTQILNENEELNASDDLNVSDDESSDELVETDANIQTGSNWRNIVSRWISMLEDETNEENDDDDDESNSNNDDGELDISIINISNLPHPARDQNSKWKLQDIFIESLGEPNYLSAFMLGNNQ